ncbi:MAG TPA: phosphopentomutase, partial [Actinomycetota bacterium]|nr:phosphopentomutase [Actinomycetota bacterium]
MSTARIPRVLMLVCDSFGVGNAPDAAAYGDEGSNTLGNCSRAVGGINAPNLARLGLGMLTRIEGMARTAGPETAHGRLTERSAGKDTTTGHWEMCGIVLERPFPLYPKGFPPEVIRPFEEAIGRLVLGNTPASGTEIIEELGEEHVRTGRPIVYTSGDSVFQIAAHREVVPLPTLYQWCRVARRILTGEHNVGRVIARPFTGTPGHFTRTPERRDFSVPPPGRTVLDFCRDAGVGVYGVGKIQDIFAGQGMTEARYSDSNDHGVDITLEYLGRPSPALVFTNLVDFDSKYGHRNDPAGYAACIEALDPRLAELEAALDGGAMFLT